MVVFIKEKCHFDFKYLFSFLFFGLFLFLGPKFNTKLDEMGFRFLNLLKKVPLNTFMGTLN